MREIKLGHSKLRFIPESFIERPRYLMLSIGGASQLTSIQKYTYG